MAFKQVLDVYELLDDPSVSGRVVAEYLRRSNVADVTVTTVEGPKGSTDFLRMVIPGTDGKTGGGSAPTMGLVGRLGGLGARPGRIGFVSDGDGALATIAAAAKIGLMAKRGDALRGDVILTTHVCPCAPTRPNKPVAFMSSPIEQADMRAAEADKAMDAILSVDTTKGNRIINNRGFAVSPTVKEGYILRVSEDILDIMQNVTGLLPKVFAITTQDITPYGNDLYHMNSIMQPCVATRAPTVGVAITAECAVPGCATGATHLGDVEMAARFMIEVAKAFTEGACAFYDPEEFARIQSLYGSMSHLQTLGKS